MKVYSPDNNHKLQMILAASKIYNRNVEHEIVDFDPKVSKSFKQAHPDYCLPLLETEDNKFISGTHSILLYLSGRENFWKNPLKHIILQQLQKLQQKISTSTGILVLHKKCCPQISQQQVQKSRQTISQYLKQQNEKLALRTFLVGDAVTVADISMFFHIRAVLKEFAQDLEKLRNLPRWMAGVAGLCGL